MPTYEYTCPQCSHTLEQLRAMAHKDDPLECPVCEAPMQRKISLFSTLDFKEEGRNPVAAASGTGASCDTRTGHG